MKPDEFETRLSRIPLAAPPPTWRMEILQRSAAPYPQPKGRSDTETSSLRTVSWGLWLRRWAAPLSSFAGAWAMVLLLHGTSGWIDARAVERAPRSGAPQAASLAALRQHCDRLLDLASHEEGDPFRAGRGPFPPPSPPDRPRSAVEPCPRGSATVMARTWA